MFIPVWSEKNSNQCVYCNVLLKNYSFGYNRSDPIPNDLGPNSGLLVASRVQLWALKHRASIPLVLATSQLFWSPWSYTDYINYTDFTVLGISQSSSTVYPTHILPQCSHDAVQASCTVIHFIYFIVAWTMIERWSARGRTEAHEKILHCF